MWTSKIVLLILFVSSAWCIDLNCHIHQELDHIQCQLPKKVNDSEIIETTSYKSRNNEDYSEVTDLVLIYKHLPQHMLHGIGKVFKKLISIDVSSSHVKFFDKICFEKMENLKFLRLAHNEVEELPGDVLEGLENLEFLDLSRNKLKNLPVEIFSKNKNLKILKLNENQISELANGIFGRAEHLRKIYLNGNKLGKIGVDFRTFRELSYLDLIGNVGGCNFRFDKKEMKKFSLETIQDVVGRACN